MSFVASLLVALWALARGWPRAWSRRLALAGASSLLVALLLRAASTARPTAPASLLRAASTARPTAPASPINTAGSAEYATSNACRSCHPAEYRSWHKSYHRSMTELATPELIRAPLDDAKLSWRGRDYALFRRGGAVWARLPDPNRAAARARAGQAWEDLPDVERPVVMTTGSHHYQAYWVPGSRGNELWQFPFIYHFAARRFIPRSDAFLQPPDDPAYWARWNSNCIQCHSVAGQPRHDPVSDEFDSRAAELGIACEACHGPGAGHVARHQNPLTSYAARRDATADTRIVNPARLDAERASEVCGQCHSYFVPHDPDTWWDSGFTQSYRPGGALADSRSVLDGESDPAAISLDASLDSLFYPDGTIRVGGREWNGLRRSACFEGGRGERRLSCLSCHQMHGESPDDQLGPGGDTNASCQSCHAAYAARPSEHTHHRQSSSGSLCVNCHMPHTTYALLKAIRSHRITRPVVDPTPGAALNACNLCHQNQSLAWTSLWLERWYGRQQPSPAAPPEPWSAAAVGLLRGDAATRVIVAHQLGWAAAREISGQHWQAQLLAEALDDPYAAVRFVAHRSLSSLPGFDGFSYDFLADPALRAERQAQARDRARAIAASSAAGPSSVALPIDSEGAVDPDLIERLSQERDERPIRISE